MKVSKLIHDLHEQVEENKKENLGAMKIFKSSSIMKRLVLKKH